MGMDELIEFYASEALMCPRRVYYRLKGYPPRWPANVKVRLQQGIKVHKIFGEVLRRRYSYELEKHMVLKAPRLGFEIHGRIDAFREHPIEIKGKTSVPREPYDYHLAQLNIYMRWANAEWGYLYYIRLGNEDKRLQKADFSKFPLVEGVGIRAFEVPYDKKLFHETLREFYKIKKAYEKDKPPKGWDNFMCRFCPYRYLCYPEDYADGYF